VYRPDPSLPPAKPQSRTILGMDRANFMPAVAAAGILLLVLAGAVMVMYNEQAYTEAKTQQVEAQSRILASTVTAAVGRRLAAVAGAGAHARRDSRECRRQ